MTPSIGEAALLLLLRPGLTQFSLREALLDLQVSLGHGGARYQTHAPSELVNPSRFTAAAIAICSAFFSELWSKIRI